jgi:hypothetical protein
MAFFLFFKYIVTLLLIKINYLSRPALNMCNKYRFSVNHFSSSNRIETPFRHESCIYAYNIAFHVVFMLCFTLSPTSFDSNTSNFKFEYRDFSALQLVK